MTDAPVNSIPTDRLGYNAVILYLIADNRLREIMLSLSYLHRWVPMHPWPIILFYASDMDDPASRNDFMMRLYDFLGGDRDARWFVSRIEWIRLHWALPEGFSHDVNVVKPVFEFAWPGASAFSFYATRSEVVSGERTSMRVYLSFMYQPYDAQTLTTFLLGTQVTT